ncbi:hypothetical protein M514_28057 [Trichuris suis]|uniref:Peptidase A2 domain-containing protein n=1 Tax=Trichuris suis TaxID=68888 RepID=A0A085MRB4_9BILA|nr:hypothetical protein M514_28057 [Trichuris suis]
MAMGTARIERPRLQTDQCPQGPRIPLSLKPPAGSVEQCTLFGIARSRFTNVLRGITGRKEGYCGSKSNERYRKSYCRRSNQNTQENQIINSVIEDHIATHRRFAIITVANRQICFRIDTVSDVTVLTTNSWKRLDRPRRKMFQEIQSSSTADTQEKIVSGNPVKFLGQLSCAFSFGHRKVEVN